MKPCPLFVELCAGTAALSLRLHARNARPPVARMGAKTGYADAILGLAGLTPGQRADGYVWAEADPVARAVLAMYVDSDALSGACHELRSWLPEDPGALFARLADALSPSPAAAAYLSQAAYRRGNPASGYDDEVARGRRSAVLVVLETLQAWARGHQPCPASVLPSAHDVGSLPPGSVVYIDPPYVGTTGYGHHLPRSEVVALAMRHADHLVMVSEAEPVAELVALGWHAVDITEARVGQKRTFSKQQREWVTMNRAPVVRPAVQGSLW